MIEVLDFNHVNEIINIILFISTGTLTLVGLVSFFGSLTIQQRINVARNILSDIENLVNEEKSSNYIEKVINLFNRYKKIENTEMKFEKQIVLTVKMGLILILLIWLSIPIITIPTYHLSEWIYLIIVIAIISVVIILFYRLISKLLDSFGISALPKYNELLDLSKESSLDLVELVAKTMKIQIDSKGEEIEIEIGFPILFIGLSVRPWISTFESSERNGENVKLIYSEENFIAVDGKECFRHLSDKYVWYKWAEKIKIKNISENNEIQFDVCSVNEAAHVHFTFLKSEIIENCVEDGYYSREIISDGVSLFSSRNSDIIGF